MKVANIRFLHDFSAGNDLVYCSPNQIKQVCLALLVNAAEAIGENGELVFSSTNPDERHIRIDVTDNGPGISNDDMPHIFEPFYTTKAEGLGIGLAICRSIVEFHKGRLWVERRPQGGTIFKLTLPREP